MQTVEERAGESASVTAELAAIGKLLAAAPPDGNVDIEMDAKARTDKVSARGGTYKKHHTVTVWCLQAGGGPLGKGVGGGGSRVCAGEGGGARSE